MTQTLVGTAPLLRTSAKHDGRLFAPWVMIATLLTTSSVLLYDWLFPTVEDKAAFAGAVGSNPAIGLIFGPAYDLTTADGFNAWRGLALGGFLTALGAIFAVTRATRAQEDSGQAELLASGVMGRSARLMTGVGMGLLGSLMVGLVSGLVTVACGGDLNASMLLAATFTATGWMFTGVAAVTAQLASDARTANSMAVGTLGVLFLARGVLFSLDAPEWTTWINPLGWMTETKPAAENNWWPLLLAAALTAMLLALAFVLQGRRDFGVGAIAPRPGPDRGRQRSTLQLALRINRGPILTWTIAFVVLGNVYGFFITSIKDILGADSAVQQILVTGAITPEALIGRFILTLLTMMGIIAAVPGVQTMLKVRSEELEDRVEPLVATGITRVGYFGSNVLVALAAPTFYMLLASALTAAIAAGGDIGVSFGDVALQGVLTVVAVWTVVAVSVAVVGARPAVSVAAWIGVLGSFGLTLLGPTFRLPDWALGFSPFWHVPNVTDSEADWLGLVWISLVTVGLVVVGFAGFRRRDLAR